MRLQGDTHQWFYLQKKKNTSPWHLSVSSAEVVKHFLEGAAGSATLCCLLAALALNRLNLRSRSVLIGLRIRGEKKRERQQATKRLKGSCQW